ncbi:S41 family peptidase [Niabella beijingensis]|uniref:S41 family peptidase n=1 Tax=Niabella beijingensis TaxID=2872700 RepID=UPI001CBF2FDD|nr:S41 family peptidase [Niabella beijingensis]MBZ4189365.1 hypothetical protein [Niabella beijingensis]
MNIRMLLKFKTFFSFSSICLLVFVCSCKKRDLINNNSNPDNKQVLNMLDSIYLYASQIYLWNEQLPEYKKFNPKRFYQKGIDAIEGYRNEIFELSRFAINPQTGKSYEENLFSPLSPKYSAIIGGSTSQLDDLSANGHKKDYNIQNAFGLAFVVKGNSEIYVLYVDPNSAAGRAGLKRGNRITKISDQPVQISDAFYHFWISALKEIFVQFEIIDNLGNQRLVKLGQRDYDRNPVLKYSIIKNGNKKFGFLAYNEFTSLENTSQYLQPAFSLFQKEGISDLIIDLRYNGGGYQNSAQYIANNIVPETVNGAIMFTEHYNQMMQNGKADILVNQPLLGYDNQPIIVDGKIVTLFDFDYGIAANTIRFEKEGPLQGVKNVYFIVSKYTASSSELLINVLKPYVNVKLVGVTNGSDSPVRTYGKPVGFFDITLNDYKLYLAMYQDKNANGDGDFFDGLIADFSTRDTPEYDFGSVEDPAIQWIVGYSGNFQAKSSRTIQSTSPAYSKLETLQYLFNRQEIGVMIKDVQELKLKKR